LEVGKHEEEEFLGDVELAVLFSAGKARWCAVADRREWKIVPPSEHRTHH
jgi:hypothetical protein